MSYSTFSGTSWLGGGSSSRRASTAASISGWSLLLLLIVTARLNNCPARNPIIQPQRKRVVPVGGIRDF